MSGTWYRRRGTRRTAAVGWAAVVVLQLAAPGPGWGHFGAIIPSDDMVSGTEERTLGLTVAFLHPFGDTYMEMERPVQFGVLLRGQKQSLLEDLSSADAPGGGTTWSAEYRIQRPGDHVFYCEPAPYYEPSEGLFIIHYSKVVVHAMGMEVGWDSEVGLKTEIVPLTRPYGLWSGNVFQGVVKLKGAPVPGAGVEVAFHNTDGIAAPDEGYAIQVVKADANGVFTYAMPRAGWWGFSALSTDDRRLVGPDGRECQVEIGAVLWVKTRDMK
ncbi:DUF4198 domain-containing protein [Candidatus Latescibacterota bacterium]